MHRDQLHGCHQRLQRELARAYATEIWDSPRIHRLTRDLAEIDREIAALQRQEDDDDDAPVQCQRSARIGSGRSLSARSP